MTSNRRVTPHAGVWIETHLELETCKGILSLPTRECGLKQRQQRQREQQRHSPRGSVD